MFKWVGLLFDAIEREKIIQEEAIISAEKYYRETLIRERFDGLVHYYHQFEYKDVEFMNSICDAHLAHLLKIGWNCPVKNKSEKRKPLDPFFIPDAVLTAKKESIDC